MFISSSTDGLLGIESSVPTICEFHLIAALSLASQGCAQRPLFPVKIPGCAATMREFSGNRSGSVSPACSTNIGMEILLGKYTPGLHGKDTRMLITNLSAAYPWGTS